MANLILQEIDPLTYRPLRQPSRFLKDEYVGLSARSSASAAGGDAVWQVENVIHVASSTCALHNRYLYVIASLGGPEENQRKFVQQEQISRVEQPRHHVGMMVRWDRRDQSGDVIYTVHRVQTWSRQGGYVYDLVNPSSRRGSRGGPGFATLREEDLVAVADGEDGEWGLFIE